MTGDLSKYLWEYTNATKHIISRNTVLGEPPKLGACSNSNRCYTVLSSSGKISLQWVTPLFQSGAATHTPLKSTAPKWYWPVGMWLSAFLNRCEFHLCLKTLPERGFKWTLSAQPAATVNQTAASLCKNSLFLYTPHKCQRNKEVVFNSADIKPSSFCYTLGKHKTYPLSKTSIDSPLNSQFYNY